MRDGFFYFENYRNIAKNLPDDLRLKFYDALNDYMFEGKESEDNIIKALITALKPSLDKVETRGGNNNPFGCKGKPKEKEDESKDNQNESKKIKNESNDNQKNQSFNKQEIKNKKEEKNNISSDKSSEILQKNKQKTFSDEFEKWWKECPKKVSKDDAYRKFNTILAGGIATFDDLFDGIKRYAEHCAEEKTEPHYIKHPSTWLNQGCWKDEYPIKWKTIDAKPNAFDIFNQAMDEIERRAAQ